MQPQVSCDAANVLAEVVDLTNDGTVELPSTSNTEREVVGVNQMPLVLSDSSKLQVATKTALLVASDRHSLKDCLSIGIAIQQRTTVTEMHRSVGSPKASLAPRLSSVAELKGHNSLPSGDASTLGEKNANAGTSCVTDNPVDLRKSKDVASTDRQVNCMSSIENLSPVDSNVTLTHQLDPVCNEDATVEVNNDSRSSLVDCFDKNMMNGPEKWKSKEAPKSVSDPPMALCRRSNDDLMPI